MGREGERRVEVGMVRKSFTIVTVRRTCGPFFPLGIIAIEQSRTAFFKRQGREAEPVVL